MSAFYAFPIVITYIILFQAREPMSWHISIEISEVGVQSLMASMNSAQGTQRPLSKVQ